MADQVNLLLAERQNLLGQMVENNQQLRAAVEKDGEYLRELMDALPSVSVPAETAPKKPGRKGGRGRPKGSTNKVKGENEQATPRRQPRNKKNLKEHVLEIVARHKDGMTVADIALEVEKLIKKGEYKSSAKNIIANVQQAVHALKAEKLLKKEDKNYVVAKAA